MIFPIIIHVLLEVFETIPEDLKNASLSVGATKWQTVKLVILRKAAPGVISAIVLGLSRAFGETLAVLMVVGNVIMIPISPLDPGYPITALIANNYGEMMSIPLYDSALMLASLILFVIVLVFNFISRRILKTLKEKLHKTMNINKVEEGIFKVLMKTSTLLVLVSLFLIIYSILQKGLPSLSWAMITQTPKGGFFLGKGGGILNAIVGSLYLAGGSTILGLFISLPVALYLNVYRTKTSQFADFTRLCLDVLWGIPSIVYGAFGFAIMLLIGLKASLLAGIITLTLMVIPIMVRAMDEVIMTVPKA